MSGDELIDATEVQVSISATDLNAAMSDALREVVKQTMLEDEYLREKLHQLVEDALEVQEQELTDLVRLAVSAYAPTNANIKNVIEDVQKHLDRYPSLANDVGMQNVVGVAINDYLMKRL